MKSFNHTLGAAIASALLMVVPASAAGMMSDSMSQDATFSMKFSQAGAAEMTMAREALKKSSNAAVVSFAHKMIADHTLAGQKLAAIANPKGFKTPMTPDAMSASMAQSLMAMSGAGFDRSYKADNVSGHQKALALLRQEVATGTDPKLVAYAKMTIPTVQQHLMLAENLPST